MPPRPTSVGVKVVRWLQRQAEQGREPSTPTALARVVGCDQKTVVNWIDKGRSPTSRWIGPLATAMGVDPGWLADDSASWPPEKRVPPLAALAATVPLEEQVALVAILSDPAERAAIIAADKARRAER